MKKFSFITVKNNGERIHLTNVLIGIVYKEDVAVLRVLAEINNENLFELISKGVEFIKEEQFFVLEDFIPMCLESTRR